MKKTYTKPQIVDYGSIAEMTAGQIGTLHSGPCYGKIGGVVVIVPCK